MKSSWGRTLLLALLALLAAAPTLADELSELQKLRDTTINLLNLLVEQGVITREKADALIRQAEQGSQPGQAGSAGSNVAPAGSAAAQQPATKGPGTPGSASAAPTEVKPGVVRVPYIPETVKEEIRDQVKQDVVAEAKRERWGTPGALPQWLDRVTVFGDVRFRGEADRFPTDNVPNATPQQLQLPEFGAYPITNSTDPYNRLRIRARLGATADLGTVTTGVRLATGGIGAGGNAASENQTLGNYNAHEAIGVDRAFIAYHPVSWFQISGGRIGNPYFERTTLVWATDLSLEGIAATFTPKVTDQIGVFATAGAFPILDVPPSPLNSARSKWLYGYQTGLHWQINKDSALTFGTALYDYRHLEGIPNPDFLSTVYNSTAAPFRQGGNSVFDINALANTVNGTQNYLIGLASKFKELNVSTSLDLGFGGRTHVMLDLDYVKNIGFDRSEILERTGLDLAARNTGAQAQLIVGDPSIARRYAWQALVGYRYVQRDSVVDGFTDSDFRIGGTDTKGYILGAEFAFETNSTVRVRWMSAKQIDGLPYAVDVLQLDAITAF